jgi:AraC-like DNA-binding protein
MAGGGDELESQVYRFSTDTFSAPHRLTRWRETCARAMMNVDMAPLGDEPFRCSAELRQLPNLRIAFIETTPNRLTRGRDLIKDANDDFIFVMTRGGNAQIAQHDHEATLAPTSALLVRCDEPSTTVVPLLSRFVSLAIPASVLAPQIAGAAAASMSAIPGDSEIVRLLLGYIDCLRETEFALSSVEARHAVVTHIHDLVALAIGATRATAEIANGRGVRAARLRAIKADVKTKLGRQELSAETIAFSQGVTPRYVRKLFENEGTSFSEFVLGQRLARVRSMLEDPRHLGRTISAIAFECGFSDLSYFNRTFRRRYGSTPSDVREQARTVGGW